MVNMNQFRRGITAYADNEILNKLPATGLKKLGFGTAITLFVANVDRIIAEYSKSPIMGLLGVMDTDGTVNIDALAEALKKNMGDSGEHVEVNAFGVHLGDITLHRADVDTLRSYILNA